MMRPDQISKQPNFPIKLDLKYYLMAGLCVILAFQYALVPSFELYPRLVGAILLALVAININKPAEVILLISMAYFVNLGDWFTKDFALTEGSGSRILAFDLLIGIVLLLSLYHLFKERRFPRFFMIWLFLFLTAFWLMNFIQGLLMHRIGYVIGEGRFYFASFFFLAILLFFKDNPNYYLRKLLKIISLCSLIIMLFMVLLVISGHNEEGRFNPGNSEVEVLVFGMIISLMDYSRRERNHILKVNPIILVPIYLIFITVSGVRTMNLVAGVILLYFLYVSKKFSIPQKIIVTIVFMIMGAGLLQLDVVNNVVQSQMKYVRVLQGKGEKHSDTTFGWRVRMWGICWETIAHDERRIFLGRPFSFEEIDISELRWDYKESGKIDNSLVHNDYLAIALTNGVLFACLLVLMIITFIVRAFYLARRNPNWSYLLTVFGWFLFCQLIQSATNAEIKHYGFSLTLWMHMGWLGVLFKKCKQEKLITYGFSKDFDRDSLFQPGSLHRSRYSKHPKSGISRL